jgi:hypothetical protein
MNDVDRLLEIIDRFHITDRALLRARETMRRQADESALATLASAAKRYFGAMHHEAERQLVEIDRRLDDIYQRQYNLQAERGVTQRRLSGAREALEAIARAAASSARTPQGRG